MTGIGVRKGRIVRDWALARAKVVEEGVCRNCPAVTGLEAAHVLGREHDFNPPLRLNPSSDEEIAPDVWAHLRRPIVHPDRIIPLCGPVGTSGSCHGKDHAGKLEKQRLLTLDEQLQAVADAGSIEGARVRLVPRSVREAVA